MRMESAAGVPQSRTKTLLDIKAALEAGGIEFIGTPNDRPGIRLQQLNCAVGSHCVLGISADLSSEIRFVLLLFLSAFQFQSALCRTLNLLTCRRSLPSFGGQRRPGPCRRYRSIASAARREPKRTTLIWSRAIVAVAQPRDAIEEFLTRDVIELTWDIFRLRRVKAGLLRASINTGVEEYFQ